MVGAIPSCKRFLQWMQQCNKGCLEIDVQLWRSFVTTCCLSWVNYIVGQCEQHLRIFGYGYIIAGGKYAQPQHRNLSTHGIHSRQQIIKIRSAIMGLLNKQNTFGAACFIQRMANCQSRAPVLVIFDRTPWYELWRIVRCNLWSQFVCRCRLSFVSQLEYAMLQGWSASRSHDLDHGFAFKVAKKTLIGPPLATHSSIFFLSTFENAFCSYRVLKANVIDGIR